jgi:hypothetical protein
MRGACRAFRRFAAVVVIACLQAPVPAEAAYRLEAHTVKAWGTYVRLTENRIDLELNNPASFLRSDIAYLKRARSSGAGQIQIQSMETKDKGKEVEVKDGTIHHWMGAVFVPDATVDKLVAWVQDYDHEADYYQAVEKSKLLSRPNPDTFNIVLRLAQSKLGVTVKFNTEHTVVYRRHGAGRVSSKSLGTKIAQVENAGTSKEKELPPGDDGGYLWRLNSYWRFAERDGGVVVECETIGLSRPLGIWYGFLNILMLGKVRQVAESVARESLEDTLAALRDGIRTGRKKA